MTSNTITPQRTDPQAGRDGFAQLLRAEWTKFRSVRGWVIGMAVAALFIVLIGLLGPMGSHSSCEGPNGPQACPIPPTGPGGEAVADTFYFVHRPLAGNGGITVRVTALTGATTSNDGTPAGQGPQVRPGLHPWAKAGLMIKDGARPGSAYAAIMVTGRHGVRMQHNFTEDTSGGAATAPRWLRLTRSGHTLTGYQSADGTTWTKVGTARLAGLPATVQAGLFTTSPLQSEVSSQSLGSSSVTAGPTRATAAFSQVGLQGTWPQGAWRGQEIGGPGDAAYPSAGGEFRQGNGTFTVTGSGDIAPVVSHARIEHTLTGAFAGLIGMIVVGTLFITTEYRRGLIRTTFAATPRRARVLVAKAIVIGSVAFVAGLVACAVSVLVGVPILRDNGNFVLPVSRLTELRVVAGTAALLAIAAVLGLAVGALLRRSALAITAVIAAVVLPFLLTSAVVLPAGPAETLLRFSPTAAFAIQQSIPQYPQVSEPCMPGVDCYPLPPWAGLAVLCGYAGLALALAIVMLRRRDA